MSTKIQLTILSLLFILLAGTSFVFSPQLMQGVISAKMFWFWTISTALFGYSLIISVLRKRITLTLTLTWVDIIAGLLFLYIVLRSIIPGSSAYVQNNLITLSCVMMLYVSFRILLPFYNKQENRGSKLFVLVILLAGIGQAVYGLLQLYGFASSFHQNFTITGTFFNPAPYSAFITLCAVIGLGVWLFSAKDNKFDTIVRYTGIATVLLVLLVLPAARSRASWLGLLGGVALLLGVKYNIGTYIPALLNTQLKRIGALAGIVIVLGIAGYGLYTLKPQSVQGRLLVWKINTRMAADNPVTGVGFGKYSAEYGNYQAEYFAANAAPHWQTMTAGYEHYAFNDYLHTLSETGFPGLVLLLLLIGILAYTCIKRIPKHNNTGEYMLCIGALAALAAFFIIALFSYPFSIIPLLILLVFCTALIAPYSTIRITIPAPRSAFIALLCVYGAGVFLLFPVFKKQHAAYKAWGSGYQMYQMGNYDMAISNYRIAYPDLQDNGKFLTNYGKACAMGKHREKATGILHEAKHWGSDPVIYTSLGKCYKATEKYAKAEKAYRHAHNIIPNRLYPLYLLAKLYDTTGRNRQAVQTAQQIIHKDIKVKSQATKRIKNEMKQMIKK